ncbi:MAG: tryptophan synthase alpha chain [Lentimonas sp.]|jgi:tryptophan synthase alpha chain
MNPFKKDKKQIGLFATAGFPELNSAIKIIPELSLKGADFIEVGIPFSDPMADGPTIQHSSEVALKNGMNMSILFDQLEEVKAKVNCPLVLMGYLNPVLTFGLEKFLRKCNQTSIKTVILPDMSIEIYERFHQAMFEEYGVSVCFLITQNTPDDIIKRVAKVSANSFVYLVSSVSITGSTQDFSIDNSENVNRIRKIIGDIPLFMGFGISTRKDVEMVQKVVDGAIIGSAYLKSISLKTDEQYLKDLFLL